MWIVMCRVSGGVTGTREGPMRQGNPPQVMYFDSREEAQREASAALASTMGNRYRTADFHYWVEEA